MVRWLDPKGGGADTPGKVANKGRTLKSALECPAVAAQQLT